jgi:uncharacterized protein YukE
VTPRTRHHTSGSSHTSTHVDTGSPTRSRPDTDAPGTPTRRPDESGGTGGGRTVDVNPDHLDSMAGRLSATGGRVDAVGTRLSGVNVGAQSMGIVGSTFTGAAQTHVQTAREHVTRTREAVQQAQDGTKGTAETYRQRDANTAAAMSSIDTATNTPRTSADTSTSPSSSTTPSGTSTTTPPTTGSTGTPGSTSSTPAGPSTHTPPAVGGSGPPPPPPPGGGGGGSTPPVHTPPGSSGQHWRDTVRDNFSDKDYADFERAMDKLSQEPHDGQVPGSGQLTTREKDLMARAMGLVDIEPNTRMQKVIPEGALHGYLGDLNSDGTYSGGPYKDIRGFTARHQDAGVLHTPADQINGNRLDYRGSPYDTSQPHIHTMEYPAGEPTNYQRPVGAPSVYGGISGHNPEVQRHADDMMDAADRAGVDPNTYQRSINSWPYSGAGVTAHSTLGIPEFEIQDPLPIPHGATINEYDAAGNKRVVAVYDEDWGWMQPGTTP